MKNIALMFALFSACLAIALTFALFMFIGSGKSDYEICIEKQVNAYGEEGKEAFNEAFYAEQCAKWFST